LVSVFQVTHSNVILETVKKAEDSNAIIARFWESLGGRGSVTIKSSLKLAKVISCDGLEVTKADQSHIEVAQDGHSFTVPYRPFEIATFKLVLV